MSGNVSLYNETDGSGILPTPTIGAVGILASLDDLIAGQPQDGDIVLVIGETFGHLGQSALLTEAFGIEAGDAPSVDLAVEKRNGDFLRANRAHVRAATDLADGGLALAAFEMAEAARLGVTLDAGDVATLFGEDQARYLVACDAKGAAAIEAAALAGAVPVARAGRFGGATVTLGTSGAPLADLSALYRSAFEKAVG